MSDKLTVVQKAFGEIAPDFAELTDRVLFGEVWQRPGLSQRDRSLITVATLVALYRTNELPNHLKRAIDNGVSRDELVEAIMHLAFYSGWGNAIMAVDVARNVFERHNIGAQQLPSASPTLRTSPRSSPSSRSSSPCSSA